jgi:hypothetical protein
MCIKFNRLERYFRLLYIVTAEINKRRDHRHRKIVQYI